ncbi:MAG TPA: endo-1,4-beta-xylanase [Candidatus Dormibacteraeota bacterium]|nr:endo-1,4-beta-xylanase [Candidatus Dormibacteraeota bacterium]
MSRLHTEGRRRHALAAAAVLMVAGAAAVGTVTPARVAAASGATWTNAATSGPAAQAGAAMAWDQATGTDVLFTTTGQTWTWNGSAWSQQSPASSPSARSFAAMAYDVKHGVVVLFGGLEGTSTYDGDTWTWDGTSWTQQHPTLSPPGRGGSSMAWDGQQQRMMLFGGFSGPATFYGDTWMWDGSSWNEFEVNFVENGAGPAPRTEAMMTGDAANNTIVLFGGASVQGLLNDTWVWYDTADGGRWIPQTPVQSPPARGLGGFAYEALSNRADLSQDGESPILFGGAGSSGYLQDTWSWDGNGWSQVTPSGQPSARRAPAAAAGPSGSVVLFGGADAAGGDDGDTWTFSGGTPAAPLPAPTIVSCPAEVAALPTTTGTGTLRGAAAVSHPGLYIGAALTADQITDADVEEQITSGSQFNLIASSNQMWWSADENEPYTFNFCDGDQFVARAQAYHQTLRLHNLLAGTASVNQTPQWIQSPTFPWTAKSLSAVMQQYITTVINHYRGKVGVYDVANEAMDNNGNPSVDVFQQTIGYPYWVEQAFQYARAANPQATLLYDDYNDWYGTKFTNLQALVNDLKSAGDAPDAVGFEMFGTGGWILPGQPPPQSADLGTAMSTIAALGPKTAITQMTVPFFNTLTPSAGQLQAQSDVYSYVMKACLASASNCFMFMTWGVSDTYAVPTSVVAAAAQGTLESGQFSFGGALFDEAYQPRPAFAAVLSLLQ